MISVLEQKPDEGLHDFLSLCMRIKEIDIRQIGQDTRQLIAFYKSRSIDRQGVFKSQTLQDRWYASLNVHAPDYAVYDSLDYLSDLWACWQVFTRPGLRRIRAANSLPPKGVVADIGHASLVIDLGCGIGYTTAALREIWQDAQICGTNFIETPQGQIAYQMGLRHGFSLFPNIEMIKGHADLVVATEYFEHILEPIDHLHMIIEHLQPRCFLIANAFNTISVGHFYTYLVDEQEVDSKDMSVIFNQELIRLGYEKIKTRVWNQRPSYWRKTGQ